MNKADRFMTDWERIRSKGKLKFILIQGFLRFGLVLFLGLGVVTPLITSGFEIFLTPTFYVHSTALLMVLFLGSILYGSTIWVENEKRYHAYKATVHLGEL